MIKMLIISFSSITLMMVFWAIVQHFWKRTFPDDLADPDALAGRSSCANCGCSGICERNSEIE